MVLCFFKKKQLKTIFYHIANRNKFFLEILILIYFLFFSQNMFYKKCKKAILVVMNAKQRRFWTFWEVKHELCAARLESLFVFLVWHPQKFKMDSRSQFSTNRAEFFWVEFFMNLNNSLDFETKVYFWTTLVNMKLHGYTIFRWCLHHFAT